MLESQDSTGPDARPPDFLVLSQGRVRERGQESVGAAPGDVTHISAGAEYWHGAHPDEPQAIPTCRLPSAPPPGWPR